MKKSAQKRSFKRVRQKRKTIRKAKRKSKRRSKRRAKSVKLPKLRPISYASKKYHYKLSDPSKKRRRAIREGIRYEVEHGKSEKDAAISKKSRFNILRIYRRNSFPDQCRLITEDMKYIDKKYKLNNTNDICS